MSLDEPSKYEPDFRDVVKRLLGAHPHQWGPTYTAEGMLAQELAKAYHRGRMDGVTHALGPVAAPGAVGVVRGGPPVFRRVLGGPGAVPGRS